MWIDNKIFSNDLEYINSVDNIDWGKLNGKCIFITGATGLIGYYLVNALFYRNIKHKSNIKIVGLVRNIYKARNMYSAQLKCDINNSLEFVVADIRQEINYNERIDFIIHAASPTSSSFFSEHPVQTIDIAIKGTKNMLELAREKNIESFVYLSSMEVYGARYSEDIVSENSPSYLDTMNVRNSYPEAKRMCENLCASYEKEYGIKVMSARLTQTFGPGISENDSRVFAQFIKAAREEKDIELLTEGKTKRSYVYLADAVTAIFTILLNGRAREVYNVANSSTYCSIYEMARLVADVLCCKKIDVKILNNNIKEKEKFLPTMCMNLDTSKLRELGWSPKTGLYEMFFNAMS